MTVNRTDTALTNEFLKKKLCQISNSCFAIRLTRVYLLFKKPTALWLKLRSYI